MDDAPDPIGSAVRHEAPIDLSVLERIEAELRAVERALEQIDQGIFGGFVGLETPPAEAAPAEAAPHGPDGDAVGG